MRKIINNILLMSVGVYLQGQNVGVNTDNPKYNLDVNGTLAVSSLPSKTGVIPLSLAKDDQQVIKSMNDNGDYKPFRIINYKFKLNTPSEDWIDAIDLKIPTDKYTLFLMSASLVDDSDVDSFGNSSSVFLNLLGFDVSNGYGSALYNAEKTERGRVSVLKGDKNSYDTTMYTGMVGIGTRQVYLYPYEPSKTWKLYADYPNSHGINFRYEPNSNREKIVHPLRGHGNSALKYDQKYTWKISVLVVDNQFIGRIDRSIDLIKGSDNQTAQQGTWILP